MFSLILITAMGIQPVGNYANISECQSAAKDWQSQGVKAGCVRQETPEQAAAKISQTFRLMLDSMPK